MVQSSRHTVNDKEKLQLVQALCRRKFDAFLERAFPIVYPGTPFEYNWHLGCIAEHLEAVYLSQIKRLIITIAPRTLKSYVVSTAFPAWILGKEPHERFICGSYAGVLSKQHSEDCRRIMTSDWYRALFPATVIDQNRNEKMDFYTTQNGRRYATSILGQVVGSGGGYIIVDDPLKPSEAQSETIRRSTNDNIDNTFMTRFNDPRTGRFVLIQQRVHEEDSVHHLTEKGGFHHLKLPIENKTGKTISLSYGPKKEFLPDELMFPQRFNQEVLNRFKTELGEYNYASQFLQEPSPLGGGEFKEHWPQRFVIEGSFSHYNIYILVDASSGTGSDYTAMMVIGLGPDNNYYWLDGVKDMLNPTQRVNKVFALHKKWNTLTGKPPIVGYEKYGMMTDTHYIMEKQKAENYRFPMIELAGNKKDRKNQDIRRLIPDMQQGRWYFPAQLLYPREIEGKILHIDLVKEIMAEMRGFPFADNDDMLDAMSRITDPELNAIFPKLDKQPEWRKLMPEDTRPTHWMDM